MDKFIYLKKRIKKGLKNINYYLGAPLAILLLIDTFLLTYILDRVLFEFLTSLACPVWLKIVCIILFSLLLTISWIHDIFIKED